MDNIYLVIGQSSIHVFLNNQSWSLSTNNDDEVDVADDDEDELGEENDDEVEVDEDDKMQMRICRQSVHFCSKARLKSTSQERKFPLNSNLGFHPIRLLCILGNKKLIRLFRDFLGYEASKYVSNVGLV